MTLRGRSWTNACSAARHEGHDFPAQSSSQIARIAKSYRPNADKTVSSRKRVGPAQVSAQRSPSGSRCRPAACSPPPTTSARFYQMLVNDGVFKGKRILSENAVRQMTSDQSGEAHSHYGFGMAVGGDGKTFSHGGAYGTDTGYDRGRRLITVFLVQHAGWGSNGETILPTFQKAAR